MIHNFHVKTKSVDNGPGVWKYTLVEVYDGDKKIGEYQRNYGSFGEETFYPFKQGDQWYALYSTDYTSTRVMTLPDCKDYCGEDPDSWGFCPTELWVPYYESEPVYKDGKLDYQYALPEESDDDPEELVPEHTHYYPFGFVSGCIWGDDTSWKIQYLDLSRLSEGVITREEKFGYIEMGSQLNLKQSITIWDDHNFAEDPIENWISRIRFRIACVKNFDFD